MITKCAYGIKRLARHQTQLCTIVTIGPPDSAISEMSLVEITWATDRLALYNALERDNRDDTFGVQHMLWFLISGRIKEGTVYVDQWPSFSHVCCLHPTRLYSSKEDRDFAVLCSTNLGNFQSFFADVAMQQRWQARDGVILARVEEKLADIAKDYISSNLARGSIWESHPLRHYTAYERPNFEAYAKIFEKSKESMPSDFKITDLKPDEATLVAENWSYEIPEKLDMFKWFIATFPTSCIRDSRGRPIAWVVTYSFGPTGASFVVPEHRGKGLYDAMVGQLILKLLKEDPAQRCLAIGDENPKAAELALKNCTDMRRTDLVIKLVVYTPHANVKKSHL